MCVVFYPSFTPATCSYERNIICTVPNLVEVYGTGSVRACRFAAGMVIVFGICPGVVTHIHVLYISQPFCSLSRSAIMLTLRLTGSS
jgi:hypothetical protein